MEKVIRGGQVAVLYSPGYGAGWYTWNSRTPACLYDPEIVALVESGQSAVAIAEKAKEKWPDGYWGGANDIEIQWIAEGTEFQIEEHDGNESFRFRNAEDWLIA